MSSVKKLRFLKSHFFAGLLVLIPLAVIFWILNSIFRVLIQVHLLLPEEWRPETIWTDSTWVTASNTVLTLVISFALIIGISILGWASKQYLGLKVLEGISNLIQRIPVIRSIYSSLDQLLKTLAAGGGEQFSRVVYIEYPRKGVWALAFVTGPAYGPAVPSRCLNVFVPATPNPTSGFHLIVSEDEVRESHLSVENAFKTILSLGIAQSSEQKATTSQL